MTENTQVTLLRRLIRPQGKVETVNPLTASRAVRLAVTKAANDTVGLVLTVQSVAEEITSLDEMLGSLPDDLMLVTLQRQDALVGLIALDMEMRAAVLEMETMGALLATRPDPRATTRTDKMLCDPLLTAFLSAFPAAVLETPLEGWADGVSHGDRIQSARAAGLVLEDRDYRIVRLNMNLGVAERQAELIIALPLIETNDVAEVTPVPAIDWKGTLQENIFDAPAGLHALLHRFPISLATAQALQVGSILPLPGCSVSSVQLMAPDGQMVAQAKLGQVGGYRAVRLENAPEAELADLSGAGPAPLDDQWQNDLPNDQQATIDEISNALDLPTGSLNNGDVSEVAMLPIDPDLI